MECPNCGSRNLQTHVVKKDKQSRNLLVMIIAVLVILAFALIVAILDDLNPFICALGCLIVSMPVLFVLKLILLIIPSGEIIVVICCDCGSEFEKE